MASPLLAYYIDDNICNFAQVVVQLNVYFLAGLIG